MAEKAGFVRQVYILAGTTAMTGSTGAKVMGVDNNSYGQLCEALDITAFGDTHRKRMPGLKDTTFTISGNVYVGDTTGQDLLVPGDYIYIGAYPSGPTVAGVQVAAFVQSFETTSDVAGKQTFTASFACSDSPVALPARTT